MFWDAAPRTTAFKVIPSSSNVPASHERTREKTKCQDISVTAGKNELNFLEACYKTDQLAFELVLNLKDK